MNYQVVDPAVEAAQARLDAMRTGRYVAPKPRQKTVKKKEIEDQSAGEEIRTSLCLNLKY